MKRYRITRSEFKEVAQGLLSQMAATLHTWPPEARKVAEIHLDGVHPASVGLFARVGAEVYMRPLRLNELPECYPADAADVARALLDDAREIAASTDAVATALATMPS